MLACWLSAAHLAGLVYCYELMVLHSCILWVAAGMQRKHGTQHCQAAAADALAGAWCFKATFGDVNGPN
jgi:hypothetical protein